jgi:uncharacterized membrane protein (TIGR02234 family)
VLVLLAVRQGWAAVDFSASSLLPAHAVAVTGQDLVPAAGALAVAGLACLAAVVATRGVVRRGVGILLAGIGAGVAAAASASVHTATVVAAAAGHASPAAGSVIGGPVAGGGGLPSLGASGGVTMASFPWRAIAVAGALAVIATGLLAAWRGERWPVMSGRFDRPQRRASAEHEHAVVSRARGHAEPGAEPGPDASPAALWESLDRGADPTDDTPG